MMPLDIALKFASASANCGKQKCPYSGQCKGDAKLCPMKEVALTLRAQCAEIDTLRATVAGLKAMLEGATDYISELEKTNKRYHDIVIAFQHGYRPKKKVRRPYIPRKPRKDLTPEEMDGDERYAQVPPKVTEPPQPLVVI